MKKVFFGLLFVCLTCFIFADPLVWNWEWAVHAGSDWIDYGYSVAVDEAGYIFVTGSFERTADFGPFSLTTSSGIDGDSDVFVAKLDPDGNWIWAVRAGGDYSDTGRAVAVDNMGNVFVTGSFRGTADFGAHELISGDYGMDVFVAKLDAATGAWIWAESAGGVLDDWGRSIAVDEYGDAYITGFFWFEATFGLLPPIMSDQDKDIFVAKIDSDGDWIWAVKAGGAYSEEGLSIVIDDYGYGYVTGFFQTTATFGALPALISTGGDDIFVAKIGCEFGNWVWAKQAGGNFHDKGYSITLDEDGCPYVTGSFQDEAAFGNHILLISGGHNDIFVAKMNHLGEWLWATSAGGVGDNKGYGIVVDKFGYTFIIGSYTDTVTFGSLLPLEAMGEYDAFIAGLDENGDWFFLTDIKGLHNVQGMSIVVDYTDCNIDPVYKERNLIIAGFFKETIYFTDSNFTLTSPGCSEIFVAKLWLKTYDKPQPVELANFAAHQTADQFVSLTWVSETETNMLGYRIYRSEINSINYAYQITTTPIPANNTSQTQVYNFVDEDVFAGHTYYYWLQSVDLDLTHNFHGPVSVSIEEVIDIPDPIYTTYLKQNQPNPFVSETKIAFSLSRVDSEMVELKIYNVKGQLVRTLHNDQHPEGTYEIQWNGRDDNDRVVPSGIYFYRLRTPNYDRINKMMFVK